MNIDYNELFGLTPDEGGKGQEVTDPASEGGQAQEIADPANQGSEPKEGNRPAQTGNEGQPPTATPSAPLKGDFQEGEVTQEEGEPSQTEEPLVKQPLMPQQRHSEAAKRREQEVNRAVQEALDKYRAERDAEDRRIFTLLGLKDPKTKELLTKREDVLEQVDRAEESAMQKRLAKGELTKEDLQRIIMQTPEIQALQARAQQAEASNEAMQAEAFEKTAQAELAAIKRYDPNIEGLSDIIAKPGSEKFIKLVQSNVSYLDAYRATWADEIAANAKSAGAAVVRSATGGKEHLRPTQYRGDGGVEVPSTVMAQYRGLMPNATEAEIRAHYNKDHKKFS